MLKENMIIGNTPMTKIRYKFNNKEKYIYTKLEYYNLTGSIKDRVAYYIINKAKENEELKENMPIVEATSGNTGISLASLGSYYNHEVHIFMPDWASKERIKIMESYGATVHLISKEEGGFEKCIENAKKMAEDEKGFLVNQFKNINNIKAHYETTGEEIISKLSENDIGGFISGVGTGGTLMGTGKKLKEKFKNFTVAALEPDNVPVISGKQITGIHKIEGIGNNFIPDLVDKNIIDKVILVNDNDSINMARKLAKKLGLGVGISSGANLLGAILLKEEIEKPVVTVFPDDNKKYLSTDLMKDIDLNNKYISNQIELLNYEYI